MISFQEKYCDVIDCTYRLKVRRRSALLFFFGCGGSTHRTHRREGGSSSGFGNSYNGVDPPKMSQDDTERELIERSLLKSGVKLSEEPFTHVASLWRGAGSVVRVRDVKGRRWVCKIIRSNASLTDVHIESYKVEQTFYKRFGYKCSAKIPTCLLSEEIPGACVASGSGKKGEKRKKRKKKTGGRAPKFFAVLEDLKVEFPIQVDDMNFDQASAALEWMATFHADFTGMPLDNSAGKHSRDVKSGLWCGAGYWNLERRRGMLKDMVRIYEKEYRDRVEKEYEDLRPELRSLGRRLKSASEHLHARLQPDHEKNKRAWFTLIHGDLKGPNMFLKPPNADQFKWTASAVDFQWTGYGLGARDVAYLLISAVDRDALDRESDLLRIYYTTRKKKLARMSASRKRRSEIMPWNDFLTCYRYAFCDFMRWLVGYGLWGGPAERWSLEKTHEYLLGIERDEK